MILNTYGSDVSFSHSMELSLVLESFMNELFEGKRRGFGLRIRNFDMPFGELY